MQVHICPICKKRFSYESLRSARYFPFCSKRCKLIDLGHWLDEEYIVPGSEEEDAAKPKEEYNR